MKRIKLFSVFAVLVLLLSATSGAVMADEPLPPDLDQALLNDLEEALSDYSRALSTGQIAQKERYTPAMQSLVQERREFYEEYFEIALHSTLENVTSEFIFDPGNVDADAKVSVLSDDRISLQVMEKVTLRGRYQASPEKYPMVQAARWALARTDNETVKKELKEYVQSAVEDVSKSSEEGFEITLALRHSLIVARSRNVVQILRDSFTNRSNDNSGTDTIVWTDREYVRNKPDLTEWPDYKMYAMSIEELGREMLDVYTEAYGKREPEPKGWGWYDRSRATNYINTFTSAATEPCLPGWNIKEDQSKWNYHYTPYTCVDCANYVSQALYYGELPEDGTWWYDDSTGSSSIAWRVTYDLADWLVDNDYGYMVSTPNPELYASEGDLGFTSGLGHVVMAGAVGPLRYSAHSNDRLKKDWNPGDLPTVLVITY